MLLVGTDLIEVERMAEKLRKESFVQGVFGEEERAELAAKNFAPQSAAVCFCAKEAFGKAMGTGLAGFSLQEVQLLHRPSGQPYLFLRGKAARLARDVVFAVSAAHTKAYATVTVVGERKDPPQVKKC